MESQGLKDQERDPLLAAESGVNSKLTEDDSVWTKAGAGKDFRA